MVEDLLPEIGVAVDRVHDLEWPELAFVLLAEAVGQPTAEGCGLLREAQPQQRVEGERRVANPRVAVVPVALAAELLGEAVVAAAMSAPDGRYVRSFNVSAERLTISRHRPW